MVFLRRRKVDQPFFGGLVVDSDVPVDPSRGELLPVLVVVEAVDSVALLMEVPAVDVGRHQILDNLLSALEHLYESLRSSTLFLECTWGRHLRSVMHYLRQVTPIWLSDWCCERNFLDSTEYMARVPLLQPTAINDAESSYRRV